MFRSIEHAHCDTLPLANTGGRKKAISVTHPSSTQKGDDGLLRPQSLDVEFAARLRLRQSCQDVNYRQQQPALLLPAPRRVRKDLKRIWVCDIQLPRRIRSLLPEKRSDGLVALRLRRLVLRSIASIFLRPRLLLLWSPGLHPGSIQYSCCAQSDENTDCPRKIVFT